ncbi:MAG TPA: sigma-70 family RNA polymerase sigma factor [Bryobacteraceae bacterium]|nr:sigma-70 family RNA polymerase sigma factor [Bryobacteraceae bacterium]
MPQACPSPAGAGTTPNPSWGELVQRIHGGDADGMADLYRVFTTGIRFFLYRRLGPQDLDDRVHDAFLAVAQAIQRGGIRQPERLMGFVHTIVRRQIAAHLEAMAAARRCHTDVGGAIVLSDQRPDPERNAISRETKEVALRILKSIPGRDREVLVRFYLQEQSAPQICREMGLTGTQFRLIKSRAKARFGELGRRRFSHHKEFRITIS